MPFDTDYGTPMHLVDWTGSGQFEELTPDEITPNQNGSISFTHSYDTPSGPSGYNAVVQIVDGSEKKRRSGLVAVDRSGRRLAKPTRGKRRPSPYSVCSSATTGA